MSMMVMVMMTMIIITPLVTIIIIMTHSDDYHYHDYQVTQRSVWGVVPLAHIVLTDSASVIQVTILIMIMWIIQAI